jgi:hypothetical protein
MKIKIADEVFFSLGDKVKVTAEYCTFYNCTGTVEEIHDIFYEYLVKLDDNRDTSYPTSVWFSYKEIEGIM